MNLQEHIRKVLRESVSPQVRRRHGEFDRIFKHYRESFINNPYKSFNSLWNTLLEVSLETLYHAWFSKTVSDDDWEESAEYIEKYLIKKYKEETKQMWNDRDSDSINESEEKSGEFTKDINDSGKYTSAIKKLVKIYEDEDFVCDVDAEYYGAADAYIIIVRVDKKEMENSFEKETIWYATERIRHYLGGLYRNIYNEVKTYFPVEVSVHITQTKCSKKLNESENKKSPLLSNIEENGLYEVISSTGLHINQIEQKVGQLSREVLERFIKDVVKEHYQVIDDDGKTYYIYLEDYPFDVIPISDVVWLRVIGATKDKLIFLAEVYDKDKDEYRDLEINLSYDNIYEIAGQLGFLLVKGQI